MRIELARSSPGRTSTIRESHDLNCLRRILISSSRARADAASMAPSNWNPRMFQSGRVTSKRPPWCMSLLAIVASLALGGCPGTKPAANDPADSPLLGKRLRLMVVDEPGLADGIRTMTEEFRLRTGAEVEVASVDEIPPPDARVAGDAIVFPTGRLSELASNNGLRPFKPGELSDSELRWQDLLPSARDHDAVWGADVVAIPLGAPVLACFYRADLLAAIEKEPPRTWREYGELAALLAEHAQQDAAQPASGGRWQANVEPWGEGWRGWMLLARAASYARHPDYYSTVFDLDSMSPRLTAPPFVRALEEMVAVSTQERDTSLQASPGEAVEAVLNGRCALAIGWLSDLPKDHEWKVTPETVAVAPLPGATEMFDPTTEQWSNGKAASLRRIPLVGVTGLLGSVTSASKEPVAARQLLAWISSDELTAKLAASNRSAPFRNSQLATGTGWRWQNAPDAVARAYVKVLAETSREPLYLDGLRLPGRDEYAAALDQSIASALRSEVAPEFALTQASEAWESITEKLDRDAQRRAYRQSLGIAP